MRGYYTTQRGCPPIIMILIICLVRSSEKTTTRTYHNVRTTLVNIYTSNKKKSGARTASRRRRNLRLDVARLRRKCVLGLLHSAVEKDYCVIRTDSRPERDEQSGCDELLRTSACDYHRFALD
jgi:hypothetical protein